MNRRTTFRIQPPRRGRAAASRFRAILALESLEPRALLAGFEVGQLRGEVFYDGDGNGSRGADEPGLSGWKLYLDENDNQQFDATEPSTESDAAGNFFFGAVAAGSHRLRQVERPGWGRTVPYADFYDVNVVANDMVTRFQFGNQILDVSLYAEISGRVWNDLDQSGTRTPGEPGLAGWQVYLDLDQDRMQDPSEPVTSTNAGGIYSFDRLPPVAFVVRQVVPTGWNETYPVSGGHFVGLQEGVSAQNRDFGDHLVAPGQLVGRKWLDLDQDGQWDSQEPPLANWEFYLDSDHDGARDPGEPTTHTDAQGIFRFLGLPQGRYDVAEVLPTGWNQTSPGKSQGYSSAQSFDLPRFASVPTGDASTPTPSLASADLDGDGDLDMVTTAHGGIVVLWNDGQGQLIAAQELMLPLATSTGAVIVADLNGDGKPDLIAGGTTTAPGSASTGRLFVFLNESAGFSAPQFEFATSASPDFLTVGDFDSDEHLDVATAARAGQTVSVLLGDGAGSLAPGAVPLAVSPGLGVAALASGDFDRDGRVDLASIAQNELAAGPLSLSMFQVWMSRATGDFAAALPVPVMGIARDLLVTDLRGDAFPEIVAFVETTGSNGRTTTVQEFQVQEGVASLGSRWDVYRDGGLEMSRTPALQAADFDGDGLTDLAVLDERGRSLWILAGRSDGTMDFPRSIKLADDPLAVVAVRLDGDDSPDLAVLSRYSSSVTVLRNDEFGGFPGVDAWDARSPLDQVESLDVDRDGDLDLVGVSLEFGRLIVSLNQGFGRFASPRSFALSPQLAAAIFDDLDGDGRLDLVTVANRATNVGDLVFDIQVRRDFAADGLKSLASADVVATFPGFATAAGLARVDLDSPLDLVVTFGADDHASRLDRLLLPGTGTGSFGAPWSIPLRPQLSGDVLLFDVDQDGDLDRVAIQGMTHSVTLERNLGGGRFDTPQSYAVGTAPNFLTATDIDGDQDLDVVVLDAASSVLSLLLDDGGAGFSTGHSLDVGGHPSALAAGDFDADGRLDLAVADDTTNIVTLWRQTSPLTFADAGAWLAGQGPKQLEAGDWNRDGRLDLASLNSADDSLTVLLQSAGLTFASHAYTYDAGLAAERFEFGYLDADEFLDFSVTGTLVGTQRVFELLNDGQGGLLPATPSSLDRTVRDTLLADVTGDARTDLVVVDDFSRLLLVFAGNGTGDFLAPQATELSGRPHFARSIDVDGDHDVDLAIGWLDSPGIGHLINDGQGNWSTGATYRLGAPPGPFWTGDLNGDGHQDYVVPNSQDGFYEYGRGRGDGAFDPPQRYAGDQPGVVGAGDFDGDGNMDLVGTLLGSYFGVYWNQTRPDDEYRVTVLPGGTSGNLDFANYRAPRPWQNQRSPLDVNDDTFVSPIDALLVINQLNTFGAGPLPPPIEGAPAPPLFNTSGDDYLSAIDALLIINYLNAQTTAGDSEGEGEGVETGEVALFAVPGVDASAGEDSPSNPPSLPLTSPSSQSAPPSATIASSSRTPDAAIPADLRRHLASRRSSADLRWRQAFERYFEILANEGT